MGTQMVFIAGGSPCFPAVREYITHTPHGLPTSDNNVGGFNFITLNQLTGFTHSYTHAFMRC